jgi:hypothetical protein
VNVVGAQVRTNQAPAASCATLLHGFQHSLPAASVQTIRRLVHSFPLCRDPLRISFDQRAPGQMMLSIDRTQFLTVQMAAVAGERNQKKLRG